VEQEYTAGMRLSVGSKTCDSEHETGLKDRLVREVMFANFGPGTGCPEGFHGLT